MTNNEKDLLMELLNKCIKESSDSKKISLALDARAKLKKLFNF